MRQLPLFFVPVLLFTVGTLVSMIPMPAASAVADSPKELFSSPETRTSIPSQAMLAPVERLATRHRPVSIETRLLDRVHQTLAGGSETAVLRLNLFDDVSLDSVIESTAPTFSGGYSLSGRTALHPHGSVMIVVNGDTVAGRVQTVDGTYRFSSVGDGRYVVSEVDVSYPAFDCEVLE